ncbi:ovate family protein 7 [Artemisia annua]|uniref:Transcription repressor n=1 Tax=Artemisia annua TaxID=35608 RepID=A0A2U1QCW1_ARTAN|nr:ovate family protein 7 [Artemisia annua]
MVSFNIFRSCRTKDPCSLPKQPCKRHKVIDGHDLPCSILPPQSIQAPCGSSFKSHDQFASQDYAHVMAKLYDMDLPRSKIYNDKGFKNRALQEICQNRKFSTGYTYEDGEEEQHPEMLISSPRTFSVELARSRQYSGQVGDVSPEWGSPARLSVFKKLLPWKVEGKVKESFAVVKRSENPYEDFKKSMMEMIVEKQMYEECDLNQLLQCFLSLNSRCHHGIIMEAFSHISNTMFLDHPSFNI